MTSIFTFTKLSTILVQYSCIKQLSSISLSEDKLGHNNTVLQKIKHTVFVLKEFAALLVLYWYIRESWGLSLKKLLQCLYSTVAYINC